MKQTKVIMSQLAAIVLLLMNLTIISCGDDDDEKIVQEEIVPPEKMEEAIVGQWYFDTDRFHSVLTFDANHRGNDIYIFVDGVKREYSFDYLFESNYLIVASHNDGGFDGIFIPSIKGNILYLSRFEDGVVSPYRTYYKVGTTGNDDNQEDNKTNESNTAEIQSYGATYAYIQGKVSLDEYASVIRPEVGIEYSVNSDFTNSLKEVAEIDVKNQFTVRIADIRPNTKFYYRVYVFSGNSSYEYGETKNFTTRNLSDNQFSITTGDAELGSSQRTYKNVNILNNIIRIRDISEEEVMTWECGIVHSQDASMLTAERLGEAIDYDLNNYIGGYSEMQYLYKELSSFMSFNGNSYEGAFDAYFKADFNSIFYYCLYVRVCNYPSPQYVLGIIKNYNTSVN